jgi:hypothetical protein
MGITWKAGEKRLLLVKYVTQAANYFDQFSLGFDLGQLMPEVTDGPVEHLSIQNGNNFLPNPQRSEYPPS